MQDTSPQQPKPKSSAGYRPLASVDLSGTAGNSATAYVVAAAGLGLGVGVAMAFLAGQSKPSVVPQAPRIVDAFNSTGSALSVVPAVYAAPSTSLLSKVDNQQRPVASSPLIPVVVKSSSGNSSIRHTKQGAHKGPSRWNLLGRLRRGAKRRPYVSSNPPETIAAPEAPTGLELATAAAAAGPFLVGIEGDVTVANFDETAGTIETYEGSKFALDKTAVASGAIPWQDFPFNVHYRCDQVGDCTMMRRGAAEGAKMLR